MKPNNVAIITGASRGIGAETAKLFARNGYAVCINYVSNDAAAQKVASQIVSDGGQCLLFKADVSYEQGVKSLFEAVDSALGPISVLVNNVGILKQQCRLEDLQQDRINEIFRVNVTSYFLCSREAIKRMSVNHGGQGGCIINVSSVAARSGSPNEYIDYAASKGAIDSLTKGLSLELAAEGIRVNAVRPGLIHTEMHASGGEAGRVERLRSKIPMQRGGQPIEIAEAIIWLASERCSFTTGAVIDVAGGL